MIVGRIGSWAVINWVVYANTLPQAGGWQNTQLGQMKLMLDTREILSENVGKLRTSMNIV